MGICFQRIRYLCPKKWVFGATTAELSTAAREVTSSSAGRWWVSPRAVAGEVGATTRCDGGRRCVGQKLVLGER